MILCAVGATACTPGPSDRPDTGSSEAAAVAETKAAAADSVALLVESLVRQYYQTMSKRDWPAYREFFWPGATLTTAWQPPGEPAPRVVPTTIEDFVDRTHLGPDSQPIFEERLIDQHVRIRGSLALVFARYEARFGSNDSVMTWQGTDAFTWFRHDRQWRIASLVYSTE